MCPVGPKQGLCLPGDIVVVDPAAGDQNRFVGPVMVAPEVQRSRSVNPAHGLLAAQHRLSQPLPGEGLRLKIGEHHVVGRVFGLGDFLQDYRSLALDILVVERRELQNIGQHVHAQCRILAQHARVEGRALTAGVGVQIAALGLDFLTDGEGRPARRPLEQQVFEKVRHAAVFGLLVAGANLEPQTQRHRLHTGHGVGHDLQTVVQLADGNAQDFSPSRADRPMGFSPAGC